MGPRVHLEARGAPLPAPVFLASPCSYTLVQVSSRSNIAVEPEITELTITLGGIVLMGEYSVRQDLDMPRSVPTCSRTLHNRLQLLPKELPTMRSEVIVKAFLHKGLCVQRWGNISSS